MGEMGERCWSSLLRSKRAAPGSTLGFSKLYCWLLSWPSASELLVFPPDWVFTTMFLESYDPKPIKGPLR